jgi:hypothetical protein
MATSTSPAGLELLSTTTGEMEPRILNCDPARCFASRRVCAEGVTAETFR